MKHPLFLLLAALLALAGCAKYQIQYEGPYSEKDGELPQTAKTDYQVLAVTDGQIRLLDRGLQHQKILQTPPLGIQKASINYAHDRIAYQVPGENIVVADSAGITLEVVPDTYDVEWFDWHSNDRTLVLLRNNVLSFHGPAVPTKATSLNYIFPIGSQEQTVNSVALAPDGRVFVAYRYYSGFSFGYVNKVRILAGTSSDFSALLPSNQPTHWMRLDRSGNHVVFGTYSNFYTRAWELEGPQPVLKETQDAAFGAVSPEGTATLYGDLDLWMFAPDGSLRQYGLAGARLTALDW